jgi:acetyl-CoA C-acetyltransferase
MSTYILPGVRSPFTRIDRELADLSALRLSVPVAQQTVVGETGLGRDNAGDVDLVLWGAVIPNLSVSNWGREVWLDSVLDPHVPAQTIIQACATSLAGATHAAGQALAGRLDIGLVGGVESMSNTQIGLSRGLSRTVRRSAGSKGAKQLLQTIGEIRMSDIRVSIPGVKERTTRKSMGEHAEEMAKEWGVTREEQDELALASHSRAVAAQERGFFRDLLVTPGTFPVDADTLPRADTSMEKLSTLPPAFDRTNGTLTAGNSSPLTDGGAACWVASEKGLAGFSENLPRMRLLDWEEAAIDPRREGLLIAPAIAIPRMLARHDLAYGDVDLWELHEAFAAQVLCTVRALEDRTWLLEHSGVDRDFGPFPLDHLNPNGGSLALGHPFAATGARILSQTVRELAERPAGTKAVVSICAAGGLGHVALVEAV